MGSRSRARGEKEPAGRTKSAIILYLADNGESTFTQVRVHLQEQFNIRSTKDVKLHLEALASDDRLALIRKISHGNGNANSYRIREGFNSLKRLHNYLDQYGAVPALMRTRYFIEYTATMDFDTCVRTNILRNSLLELHESILDDRDYPKVQALFRDVNEEERAGMLAWLDRIRKGDRDDALSGSYLAVIDMMKEGDIDRLANIFLDTVRLIRTVKDENGILEFFALMSELGMPDRRAEWVTMRRLSPGVLDYLLNSSKNNRVFPPNIFLAYVFSLILRAPGELPPIDFGRYRRYAASLPRHSGTWPIATIVRGLFIADMVYGRLIVDEVPEETLRLVFS